MDLGSQKNKEVKIKLVEEAAERLAEILIIQVELSRSNFKEGAIVSSQQNHDDNNRKS